MQKNISHTLDMKYLNVSKDMLFLSPINSLIKLYKENIRLRGINKSFITQSFLDPGLAKP